MVDESLHGVPGTRPPGTADEAAAAQYVRRLFSDVARRYDLLNHILSFNMDRYWRWAVAREFRHVLVRPSARVLDLCCGTADLTLALARRGTAGTVGADFAHAMLRRAREKLQRAKLPPRSCVPSLAEADALQLPFVDESFHLVTCAFGFRNLANYRAGVEEIRRVLTHDGELGILEFSEPSGVLAPLYSLYFHRILPVVGEWVTGVEGAYRYLATSVDQFPSRAEFVELLRGLGFRGVRVRKLTGGIAVLYVAQKSG